MSQEKNRTACKAYYYANREKRIAKQKEYAQEHREQRRTYLTIYNKSEVGIQKKKEWRERNRELTRKRDREHRQTLKYEVLSYYSVEDEPICEMCLANGIRQTDINLLTIDHIAGGGNEHRKQIGGGGQNTYRWLKRNNYPDGYRVLCFGCNLVKNRRKYAF